jgi:hypothetical protein
LRRRWLNAKRKERNEHSGKANKEANYGAGIKECGLRSGFLFHG